MKVWDDRFNGGSTQLTTFASMYDQSTNTTYSILQETSNCCMWLIIYHWIQYDAKPSY